MLSTIREFFERHIASTPGDTPGHTIELATAALLAEVVRIDGHSGDAERAIALRAINEKLGLTPDEAATLLDLASQEVRQATDYFQFTSLINRHFPQERKVRMIELMWQVAYADGRLDDHELHLIRRIADLLHVPHHDFIAAKLRAQRAHTRGD
jgi:uncharacterized tellurite resistance protein B-like protein